MATLTLSFIFVCQCARWYDTNYTTAAKFTLLKGWGSLRHHPPSLPPFPYPSLSSSSLPFPSLPPPLPFPPPSPPPSIVSCYTLPSCHCTPMHACLKIWWFSLIIIPYFKLKTPKYRQILKKVGMSHRQLYTVRCTETPFRCSCIFPLTWLTRLTHVHTHTYTTHTCVCGVCVWCVCVVCVTSLFIPLQTSCRKRC